MSKSSEVKHRDMIIPPFPLLLLLIHLVFPYGYTIRAMTGISREVTTETVR